MTADAVRLDDTFVAPYAPNWVHGLVSRIERIPGPDWVVYAAAAAVLVVMIHGQAWALGTAPVGTFDLANTYYGILPVTLLWTAGYLERVAGSAFDAFRPALRVSAAELARLRWELVVVPAVPSLVITLATLALTAASYAADPVSSNVLGLPLPLLGIRLLVESFNGSIILLLLYQLLRQMRQVSRTLGRSAVVDVFQPGPLHAFSRLTSRTGIAIVLLVVSSLVVVPLPTDSQLFLVVWAPYLFIPPIIAVIAFVQPLYGMHGRLVDEEERLQGEAEERLKGLLAEINRDVDARDLTRADGLSKTLAIVLQQREVLARLPTWPWSTGTLRTFVTAILLPLGLFLVQRLLTQLV